MEKLEISIFPASDVVFAVGTLKPKQGTKRGYVLLRDAE